MRLTFLLLSLPLTTSLVLVRAPTGGDSTRWSEASAALDALCFPQLYQAIPTLKEPTAYPVVATPQINILGLPGVTVPGGYYKNGTPFSVIFIGRKWSEAKLLNIAYAYEQASKHRAVPKLYQQIEGQ